MYLSTHFSRQRVVVSTTPTLGAQYLYGLYWSITPGSLSCAYDPRIARRIKFDAIDARRRASGLRLFRRHLGPDFDPYE